jgi:predicted aldo/keto reductase-like oxidoreductase
MEQITSNVNTFDHLNPLPEEELAVLMEISRDMTSKKSVPCTACRYCTTHCPMELDIPRLLELYNEHSFTGGGFLAPMVVGTLQEEKRHDACIGCRSCEAVCPQEIKISEALAAFAGMLK